MTRNYHRIGNIEIFLVSKTDLDSVYPLYDDNGMKLPCGWYYWVCVPETKANGPFDTMASTERFLNRR